MILSKGVSIYLAYLPRENKVNKDYKLQRLTDNVIFKRLKLQTTNKIIKGWLSV